MIRTLFFAGAIAIGATGAHAQNWYGEIYGGGVLERDEEHAGTSFDLDAGTAFGAGIYTTQWGPEIGFDIMRTDAGYKNTDEAVESLSGMVVARATIWSSGGMSAYVGGGLGAVRVTYDGGTTFPADSGDDWVPGGQLSLGVRYSLAATQAFVELKHQRAFDDAQIQGNSQSYATNSVIAGLRFQF